MYGKKIHTPIPPTGVHSQGFSRTVVGVPVSGRRAGGWAYGWIPWALLYTYRHHSYYCILYPRG